MQRSSQHTLKFATAEKKSKLDDFFTEFERVVNAFIDLWWDRDERLPSKFNSSHYSEVDSWMMGKAMKCAGNEAMRLLKISRKKEDDILTKTYKRVYSKGKKRGKNWDLITQRRSVWQKGKKFRHRTKKPEFRGNEILLNSDLIKVQEPKKSTEFDMWINIGSVFGNRYSLKLPTLKTNRFNEFRKNGFDVASSVKLWRSQKGIYYAILTMKKDTPEPDHRGKEVGIDMGINKMMSTSEGEFYGTELKQKIEKLHRRQHGSKNWNQTREEIKEYIGEQVNKFDFTNTSVIVLEDLNGITIGTKQKKKMGKKGRKLVAHWNKRLLTQRIQDRCEESRVHLAFVPPHDTSRECSECDNVSQESRKGEIYECVKCGHTIDADTQAGLNILSRFKDGQSAVAHGQKTSITKFY